MQRLRGKVVEVASGSQYVDKMPRVTIKVQGAAQCFDQIVIRNDAGLELDQELLLTVTVLGRPELEAEEFQAKRAVQNG